ncbi:MAG: hypothetical protein ACKOF9_04840, partial [Burkholderiales bacterium]
MQRVFESSVVTMPSALMASPGWSISTLQPPPAVDHTLMRVFMVTENGQQRPLDMEHLRGLIQSACADLGADVQAEPILAETQRNLYD